MKSITGERLPGEKRILKVDGESDGEDGKESGWGWWIVIVGERRGGGGEGGGGAAGVRGLEAGQHQESWGETMVGGSSFRFTQSVVL